MRNIRNKELVTYINDFRINKYNKIQRINLEIEKAIIENNSTLIHEALYHSWNFFDPTRIRCFYKKEDNILLWASTNGHTRLVRYLLERPRVAKKLGQVFKEIEQQIHIAIKASEFKKIIKILKENKFYDPNLIKDWRIMNNGGPWEIFKYLISDSRFDILCTDIYFRPYFESITKSGEIEKVRLILKNPNLDPTSGFLGACKGELYGLYHKGGNLEIVKLLIADNRFNRESSDFKYGLCYATEGGKLEIVKYFVEKYYEEMKVSISSAFYEACRLNYVDIAKYLLDVTDINPCQESRAVRIAIEWDSSSIIEMLAEHEKAGMDLLQEIDVIYWAKTSKNYSSGVLSTVEWLEKKFNRNLKTVKRSIY